MTAKWKFKTIVDMIAFILILLFIYTAASKLQNLGMFRSVIRKVPYFKPHAQLIAWTIPLVEIIIAITLLFPATRLYGFIASFILMLLLTIYVGLMLLLMPQLPCSCGGVIQSLSWKGHLFFNLGITGVSFLGSRMEILKFKIQNDFIAIKQA